MKMLAPPSLRSMRGLPCCMLRITSAPSMRSYHWAVPSGSVVRRWMWSQVYLAMVSLLLTQQRSMKRGRCGKAIAGPLLAAQQARGAEWNLLALEMLLRFDVARGPHQNEARLITAAAWRETFAKEASHLVLLGMLRIMRHAIDS